MSTEIDSNTKETTKSHSINMNALGREKRSNTLADETICVTTNNLNLYYGEKRALHDINLAIPEKKVSAFIAQ